MALLSVLGLFSNRLKTNERPVRDFGFLRAPKPGERSSTTMAKSSRTIVFLLSLTPVVIAGLTLSSPQVKHILSTVASAVWGA